MFLARNNSEEDFQNDETDSEDTVLEHSLEVHAYMDKGGAVWEENAMFTSVGGCC